MKPHATWTLCQESWHNSMCNKSNLMLVLQPRKNIQYSMYRVLYSVGIKALSLIRPLNIRIQYHSGALLSVLAQFSGRHKCTCYCSTGKRSLWWWWEGRCLSTVSQCLQGRCHPDSPTGLRLQLDTGDSCCLSVQRSVLLPLNYLSSSFSELPLPRSTLVKWSIDCPCADGA